MIGWITNILAIRMIFRPYREKKILDKKVPFTPGLIHRRRPELARKIGEVVKEDLLRQDRIRKITSEKLDRYLHDNGVKDKGALAFFGSISGTLTDKLVRGLEIDNIVCEEINRISTADIENIVYKVVGRELRYIQFLGGLLGGCIGLVHYCISISF